MNLAIAKPIQTIPRGFLIALAINFVWINASEVFRYFVFLMPLLRETFPQIENVAPMNLGVFAIWGLWDTIILLAVTGFCWLFMQGFGTSIRKAILAGTMVWSAIFVIVWLGMFNMNFATLKILSIALPLSWFEMVVAALVVRWNIRREVA